MFLNRLNSEQQQALQKLAYSVAVSDGEMSEDERQMLEEMQREMHLPLPLKPEHLDIDTAMRLFDSRASRAIVLVTLIKLGFADKAYEIEEQCFIDDLRKAFNYSDNDFEHITDWVKKLVSLEQEMDNYFT
ncbi:MAG: TerB family tellurite resistance protein [Gammaproteobacteria bacterium]|nr:TerB family tellurite resistance protein [Gammaproteobacteria bacterium]